MALNLAFLVNAAILITAAPRFIGIPSSGREAGEIQLQDAHELLHRVLGTHWPRSPLPSGSWRPGKVRP